MLTSISSDALLPVHVVLSRNANAHKRIYVSPPPCYQALLFR